MGKAARVIFAAAALCVAAMGCSDDRKQEGTVIALLADEMLVAGEKTYQWDQKTNEGAMAPPGTYGAWFKSEGYDSTAVFRIVADEPGRAPIWDEETPMSPWYTVWTGSEAYVVGELVDVHVYIPEDGRVQLQIVKF